MKITEILVKLQQNIERKAFNDYFYSLIKEIAKSIKM